MIRSVAVASLTAYVGLGFAAAAIAADQKASFESLDKNSDGRVSLNEAAVDDHLFVAFQSLDDNRNGELTREEFARYQGPKAGS
ncbi:MAG: EF-hand domain-containing protein [Lysobacterales bacterium]|nr:MAG: EF-hand domain-containing protein [Xanthomonadales bacterium]